MPNKRHHILTIGGFDPSGGAGVLADIKTFEQHRLLGMAVNTANTIQSEDEFISVNWLDHSLILDQLNQLLKHYQFKYVKIGLIPSIDFIHELHSKLGNAKIIWDPILKASAGFDIQHDISLVREVLKKVAFFTPNWEEIKILSGNDDALNAAEDFATLCNVYLKGGHDIEHPGRDHVFFNGKHFHLKAKGNRVTPKHGSGCVLSSALAANLSLGFPKLKACLKAKSYVTRVLESNTSLLGQHNR